MALPDDFDLRGFLESVDRNHELRGMRVVYFNGYSMIELREGLPYCEVGQMTIVIRDAVEDTVLHSPSAAQSRDGKLMFELLGMGLSCSAAVLGWVVVAGSAGAAPITGGASTILTYLSIGAASASSIQCVNGLGRVAAEVYAPETLDVLDKEQWYVKANMVLDGISLVGAAASTAVTIRMALRLQAATGKTMMQVLKGLSRQQRKALAEEAIRIENPGTSNLQLKTLVRAGLFPKRFSTIQVNQGIKNQLKDAMGAALSFSGSAASGLVRQEAQYIIGLARSVETYQ